MLGLRNLRKKCFHRLGRAGTSISAHSAVASRQSRRSDNVARADTNENRKNRNHDLNLMPGRPRSTWGVQFEELQKTRFCYQQKSEIVAPKLIKIILGRIYIGNAIARWTRAVPTRSPIASRTMRKRRPQEIHYRHTA